jgi:hypothetical protein
MRQLAAPASLDLSTPHRNDADYGVLTLKLITFLTHGEVPLDNNRCENSIRPFVVGRKGWLFSDTVKGAVASADLYSLVESAKANGVEPHAYLSLLFFPDSVRQDCPGLRGCVALE